MFRMKRSENSRGAGSHGGILRRLPRFGAGVLAFEREKFVDGDNRYAWKIRREFDGGFVRKGLTLARQRQEEADV